MPTTYTDAQDEMFGMANAVFATTAVSLLGYAPDVRWPGVPKAGVPDRTKLWARVSEQIVTEEQASLANANSIRLFDAIGMLYMQLFCPRNIAASVELGRAVGIALQVAFRHTSPSGQVWYRKAKMVELPEGLENYPILVSTEFQYRTSSPATAGIVLASGGGSVRYYGLTFISTGVYSAPVASVTVDALVFKNGELLSQGVGNDYTVAGNVITFLIPVAGATLALYQGDTPVVLGAPIGNILWMPTIIYPDALSIGAAAEIPNQVQVTSVVVPFAMTVHSIQIKNNVAVAGQFWGVGLYDLSGNLLFSVVFSTAVAGLLTQNLAVPFFLQPGSYYWAITTTSALTGTDYARNASNLYTGVSFSGTNPSILGQLPAALGLLTPAAVDAPVALLL